ncbi:MAG: hypothetical protein UX81_C0002G0015 [Parcubacteria group bacterium GW2011_GWA2_47_12]|nr:MAG: hypothetical protein UX81_C0002G0015 [Parcubacteria group bacterium GW2011_GWA2_47_12]
MSTNENKKPVLLFPELSYILTGMCFAAHNELGEYAREKQYADKIEEQLKDGKVSYSRECAVGASGNILDFLIDSKVILELKAKRLLLREDFRQIQNYLQQTGLQLGLLVNFREKILKPRRVVRIEQKFPREM